MPCVGRLQISSNVVEKSSYFTLMGLQMLCGILPVFPLNHMTVTATITVRSTVRARVPPSGCYCGGFWIACLSECLSIEFSQLITRAECLGTHKQLLLIWMFWMT